MTKYAASPKPPPYLHPEIVASADFLPTPTGFQRAADGYNYISCRQKKFIFLRSQNHNSVTGGSSAAVPIWPAYFRTGENTTGLEVRVGVCQTPFAAVSPPELSVYIKTPGAGTTAGEGHITYEGASATTAVPPNAISHQKMVITGLSSNTEYVLDSDCTNGMCLTYMSAYEMTNRHADDSVAGVCGPAKFVAGAPILDEHIEDLKDANNRLWKHNGAQLVSWCCDYEAQSAGTGIPRPAAGPTSYTDLYTAPLYLPLSYHNTRRRTTVPVKMAVMAERSNGAGTLSVRLTDGTSSIEVTGIGAGGILPTSWATNTGTLAATSASYKIQYKYSEAVTTRHRIYAVSLFEFET